MELSKGVEREQEEKYNGTPVEMLESKQNSETRHDTGQGGLQEVGLEAKIFVFQLFYTRKIQ